MLQTVSANCEGLDVGGCDTREGKGIERPQVLQDSLQDLSFVELTSIGVDEKGA